MNKQLTKTQEQILLKMKPGVWYDAYTLKVSLSTLESLVNKGRLQRRSGLGATYSPRTIVKFRIKANDEL